MVACFGPQEQKMKQARKVVTSKMFDCQSIGCLHQIEKEHKLVATFLTECVDSIESKGMSENHHCEHI